MFFGKVKTTLWHKGYAFLSRDDMGPDVFVHVSAVERAGIEALNVGDRVAFDIETNPRTGRPQATDLRLVASDERTRGA
jgi:CspA family cold shock protein